LTEEQLTALSESLSNAATVVRARSELLEAVEDIRQDKTKQAVEKIHDALEAVLHECCSYMMSHGLFAPQDAPADIRRLKFIDYMRLLEKDVLTGQERADLYHFNDVRVATKHGGGILPHVDEAKGFVKAVVGFGNRLGLWALNTQGSLPVAVAVKEAFGSLNLAVIERQAIFEALDLCSGNQTKAAFVLGIHRDTLRRKLTEYGVGRARVSWEKPA
jgi:hypothetical protein